jgi:peptidoglycan/LPS O-acetylase OafA/YrhL
MRLHWLQFLRAIAALLVLSGHALGMTTRLGGQERLHLPTGIGVDLFFAISGFIMIYASDRLFGSPGAGREFLIRRIGRVAPLYWISTTAVLGTMVLGSRGWAGLPDLGYIICSYLFIPDDAFGSVDGIAFPLLSLGWTLNYEMLFYAVFSTFLFLPRAKAIVCVTTAMLVLVLLGLIFTPIAVIPKTWSQAIILEFTMGMFIGHAFLTGVRMPRMASMVLLGLALGWVAFDPAGLMALKQTPNDVRRLIGWGVPAVVVLGSFILTPWRMPTLVEKPAVLLGDASYSLYLTHPFVLVLVDRIWPRLFGEQFLAALVLSGVALAIIVAVAVHNMVERPIERVIKRVRAKSPAPPLALGSTPSC